MKHLVGIFLVIICLAFGVAAQEPLPTPDRNTPVTVTQGFVDDATKAFQMVVALRDQLQKELEKSSAGDVTKAALREQIAALNGLIAIFERKDAIYQSLLDLRDQAFVIYERVIKMQTEMMERMFKQMNKGQSGFGKFLSGLKRIVTFATGVILGVKVVGL